MKYRLLVIIVIFISFGQILLKLGADGLKNGADCLFNVCGTCFSWHLLVGMVVYGMATVTWILALRDTPLSVAYPIVALSYAMVALLSVVLLGERLSLTYVLGLLFIMTGVSIIAFS